MVSPRWYTTRYLSATGHVVTLSVCHDCGSVVLDERAHNEWHDRTESSA